MTNKIIVLEIQNDKGEIVGFFKRNDNNGQVALYSCQLVSFDDIDQMFDVSAKSFLVKKDLKDELEEIDLKGEGIIINDEDNG